MATKLPKYLLARAKEILDHRADYRPKFRKVVPVEYRRALEDMERMKMDSGESVP
ncbi:hypothetical protein [Sinorhizobium meliloti]|uniref:hypothetical protein n=1 Tax=Rhizobium meliloti TaxID=382 RepID=UPI0002EBCCD9|nr:hypothetical protein [Sinorhizobium meliloti]MDE4588998.1 hypothetical protein [Sinorhizobium meliloti]